MTRNREDFVTIKLSAAGEAAARGVEVEGYDGPRSEPCVRLVGGGAGADSRGYDFEFVPDELKDVTRPEWLAIFAEARDAQGEPLFEIVERAAGSAAADEENQP